MRIVFFGTPEFAVASLEAVIAAGYNVVAVVTAPDKPAGRGMQLRSTAVKEAALQHNIPVLQPLKLKHPEFLQELNMLAADVHVVVAFRMLPEAVWNMPPLGTINVHGSLLPQYRGAAPINWAIINGETETGVTTFRLKHEIDTGDVLLQQKIAIQPEDNFGTLYEKLMQEGGRLLVRTLKGLEQGSIAPMAQDYIDAASLKHAPKLQKETGRIDWTKSAGDIVNLVRGLAPYPTAFTDISGKSAKLFHTRKCSSESLADAGTLHTDGKSFLRFAAADAWVEILELQAEGKKRMDIQSFLRGFRQ